MRPRLAPAVAPLALLLTLVVSGCGSSSVPASAPSASAPSSASASARGSYVALGDSYAAAPGVPTTGIAGGCLRSDHNYPHLLAAHLDLPLADVTCSGATTGSLTRRQRIVQVSVPPQLRALTPTTTLVTLGIGGNDHDLFGAVLDRCLVGEPRCLQGVDVRGAVATVQRRLTTALRTIHHRAPVARVVLVGYPQLVAADGRGCAILPASRDVLGTVHGLIRGFSTMMTRAARRAGATYVDLLGPSRGHDICSSSSWINGEHRTDEAVAFHPLPTEQEAVARLVAQAIG